MATKKTRTTSSRSRKSRSRAPTTATEQKLVHIEKAEKYIDDVLSGRVAACEFVKAACRRQREDLVRFKSHPIYHWSPDHGARVCRFIERLPHVKGDKAKARELFVLEPWQCFVVTTIFGWRRKDTGGRRFKRAYIEVPRGNGKSALASGIGLYCLAADGEQGAEVYSAATTRDQAKVVWETAKAMMQKRADFAQKIGVELSNYSIYQLATHSSFKALSREANFHDGLNVHCAIIDELHAHRTRETYDVIETGAAKRTSSLIFVITTAGSDTTGICYEVRSHVVKVLGGLEDDAQFGIIYTIDDGDDWTDPAIWQKANPNWNASVLPDVFSSLAFKAMQTPSAQNNFKTKHLNVWVNADKAAFDMRAWDKCADLNLKIEDFAGEECIAGVDLASKVDIAAKVRMFRRRVKKENYSPTVPEAIAGLVGDSNADKRQYEYHYYLFVTCYLPEAAVHDGRNSQYSGWELEGWFTVTPGDVLDFGLVREELEHDARQFKLREIAYDPWQAEQMSQELRAEGITTVEVRPSVQNFSAPMKELDALMREGRLHHDGNPVMRWMVSNTVGHFDAKDNIYPRKEKPDHKIDGVIATLMALGRWMFVKDEEKPQPQIRFL